MLDYPGEWIPCNVIMNALLPKTKEQSMKCDDCKRRVWFGRSLCSEHDKKDLLIVRETHPGFIVQLKPTNNGGSEWFFRYNLTDEVKGTFIKGC